MRGGDTGGSDFSQKVKTNQMKSEINHEKRMVPGKQDFRCWDTRMKEAILLWGQLPDIERVVFGSWDIKMNSRFLKDLRDYVGICEENCWYFDNMSGIIEKEKKYEKSIVWWEGLVDRRWGGWEGIWSNDYRG
jgi:hypothetical protein